MNTPGAPRRSISLLGYDITVAPWALDEVGRVVRDVAGAPTVAIITDEHVAGVAAPQVAGSLHHHLPQARVLLRAVPPGEGTKVRETWAALTDWLLGERCGRDTTIVAVGGGMVGDLAGFVAATFMRGIPFVQVPTSLLAMVDASVGGKVGVDTPHGKNLVGAFHQPAAVVVDPTVLQTLPREDLRAGMAEVIKHGVIADAAYFHAATAIAETMLGADAAGIAWHGAAVHELVGRSVEIKAAVVAADEREAPGGPRLTLNFGHSIAHALEAATDYAIPHGHAVAVGMAVEARIAERVGVAEPGTADEIVAALRRLGLPTGIRAEVDRGTLIAHLARDKKNRGGDIVMALPSRIGAMARTPRGYGVAVEREVVASVLGGFERA